MGINASRVPARPQTLRLDLIDGMSVRLADTPLRFPNAKAGAILAYLALSERQCETRERLAGLLWSERSEERARGSLRQCILQLNRLFDGIGFTGFQADRSMVALRASSVETDVDDLLSKLKEGQLTSNDNSGFRDPHLLMRGFEDLDEVFRSWLQVKRQSIQDRMVRQLEGIMENAPLPLDARRSAAEWLIVIDPTHERGYQMLIAHHAERGDAASAIRLYNQLWETLEQEHDVEPSAEIQDLIVRIKSGERLVRVEKSPPAAPIAPARSTLRLPVIGIQPFAPGGPAANGHQLISGVRRELIAGLVRFREWVIVESTGLDQSSGADGVDYLLEGTFYDRDSVCHLTMTLRDVRSHRYIWSEQYDVNFARWAAAQQEIVRRMAIAMNIYLSHSRIAEGTPGRDTSLETYQLWLRGQSLISFWDPQERARAEGLFREIIRREPNFAPAHGGIATICNSRHIVEPGTQRSPEVEREAAFHASHAVALDPLDTRSQLALAWSNAMRGRFEQAELHYGMSLDLNPNNPHTLISCAQGLAFCGHYGTAQDLVRHALALDPSTPGYLLVYAACISFLSGDYPACAVLAERSGNAILTAAGFRAAALAQMGRIADAGAAAEQFVSAVRAKWMGENAYSDGAAVAWYLDNFPIRDRDAFLRLREGLRLSGLPT